MSGSNKDWSVGELHMPDRDKPSMVHCAVSAGSQTGSLAGCARGFRMSVAVAGYAPGPGRVCGRTLGGVAFTVLPPTRYWDN